MHCHLSHCKRTIIWKRLHRATVHINWNIMRSGVKEWSAKDIHQGVCWHIKTNQTKPPNQCVNKTYTAHWADNKNNTRSPGTVLQQTQKLLQISAYHHLQTRQGRSNKHTHSSSNNHCIYAPECETGDVTNCPSLKLWMYCWGKACSTQSPSVAPLGTITLISLDLAEVIEAPSESLLKYNWHPDVLSIDIVGAVPWHWTSTPLQLTTSKAATTSLKTIPNLVHLSTVILLTLPAKSLYNCS
jgi:hypothetical protein